MFSLTVGIRQSRNAISELHLTNAVKGVYPVGVVGVSPEVDTSRNIGVPIGFAQSRSDGIGTVGTGKAAGAEAAAVERVGRGCGTTGEMLTLLADGRERFPSPRP